MNLKQMKNIICQHKTYTYSSGYKGFKFIIDDNGKVSQIEWNDYDYNE